MKKDETIRIIGASMKLLTIPLGQKNRMLTIQYYHAGGYEATDNIYLIQSIAV